MKDTLLYKNKNIFYGLCLYFCINRLICIKNFHEFHYQNLEVLVKPHFIHILKNANLDIITEKKILLKNKIKVS